MGIPVRLVPLLKQFDFAREQLTRRLEGLTDAEYFWEPVANCWTVRHHTAGPGPGATSLVGVGEWRRDRNPDDPEPAPFTTIAWRLAHLSETLAMRADYTIGSRTLTRDTYTFSGTAAGAVAGFVAAAEQWRAAILSADEAALDTVGYSSYPHGSDPGWPFIDVVWWENEELLHHGAEIALLRDLYRAMKG